MPTYFRNAGLVTDRVLSNMLHCKTRMGTGTGGSTCMSHRNRGELGQQAGGRHGFPVPSIHWMRQLRTATSLSSEREERESVRRQGDRAHALGLGNDQSPAGQTPWQHASKSTLSPRTHWQPEMQAVPTTYALNHSSPNPSWTYTCTHTTGVRTSHLQTEKPSTHATRQAGRQADRRTRGTRNSPPGTQKRKKEKEEEARGF